jgi:hypothetical protein
MTTDPRSSPAQDSSESDDMRAADVANGENPDTATNQPTPDESAPRQRASKRRSRPAARRT